MQKGEKVDARKLNEIEELIKRIEHCRALPSQLAILILILSIAYLAIDTKAETILPYLASLSALPAKISFSAIAAALSISVWIVTWLYLYGEKTKAEKRIKDIAEDANYTPAYQLIVSIGGKKWEVIYSVILCA